MCVCVCVCVCESLKIFNYVINFLKVTHSCRVTNISWSENCLSLDIFPSESQISADSKQLFIFGYFPFIVTNII